MIFLQKNFVKASSKSLKSELRASKMLSLEIIATSTILIRFFSDFLLLFNVLRAFSNVIDILS